MEAGQVTSRKRKLNAQPISRSSWKGDVDGLIIHIASIHINDLEEDYMRITHEDKDHTRQFVLDHSILKKLSNMNKSDYHKNTNIVTVLPDSFSTYARIIGDTLFLPTLNLSIPCKRMSSEQYQDIVEKEDQKFMNPTSYTLSKSYLSFKIIDFLRTYDISQIEQTRIQRLSIRQKIANLIFLQNHPWINQQAKLHMLSLFDFDLLPQSGESFQYLFQQKRSSRSEFQQKFIFNPTITTCCLFRQTYFGPKQALLEGAGGTGNTFSLILLSLLTQYVAGQPSVPINTLKYHLSYDEYASYKKIPLFIYITLSQDLKLQDFGAFIKKQFRNTSDLNIQKFLKQLKENYNRQIVIIIDQINIYQFALRQYWQRKERQDKVQKKNKQNESSLEPIKQKNKQQRSKSVDASKNQKEKEKEKKKKKRTQSEYDSKDQNMWIYKPKSLTLLQYHAFMKHYLDFFYLLKFLQFKILFSTSSNQEFYYECQQPENISPPVNILDKRIYTIEMEQRPTIQQIIDLINNIWFLLELQRRKRFQNIQSILTKRQELNHLLSLNLNSLLDEFQTIPIGLTFHRVSLYCQLKKQIHKIKILPDEHQEDSRDFEQSILNNFKKMVSEINKSCIDELREELFKFLKKGTLRIIYEKYLLVYAIKDYCLERFDKQKNIQFDCSKYHLNQTYFNADHGRMGEDGYLYLNYPPSFFLYFVRELQQNFSVMSKILDKFIVHFGSNNQIFGSIFDICCTTIITTYNLRFKICQEEHVISQRYSTTFQHFFSNERNVSLRKKMQQVLNSKGISKGQWIAASPRLKYTNFFKKNAQHASTNRCIDCLILKKDKVGYRLKTIDFALSYFQSNIYEKMEKAERFFEQFIQNAKMEDLQFKIDHYFIVRSHIKSGSYSLQIKGKYILFHVVHAIEVQFQVQRFYDHNRFDNDCALSMHKCLMLQLKKQMI